VTILQQTNQLFDQQTRDWPAARDGFAALRDVRTRTLDVEGLSFRLQFNPRRIVSSGAKVDAASIAQRKCFLCAENRPADQQGVAFEDRWTILVNPFPILPRHFTIPDNRHVPQALTGAVGSMLRLARALGPDLFIFYNGPKCGASAPDHLHFQAGNSGFLPIEREIEVLRAWAGRRVQVGRAQLWSIASPLRPLIVVESHDEADATRVVEQLLDAKQPEEPLVNVLCWWLGDRWRIVLIPRAKHRPDCYFAEGDAKVLISPASVDLAGVCVTPVERDFDRITGPMLAGILREVCPKPDALQAWIARMDRIAARR
jgi:hypothetical protein